MKTAALLAALPLASAFVAPVPKMAARGRALQMSTPFDEEPGRVQWFPQSAPYWDPLGFVKDGDVAKFNKYKAIEVKHGRVAMLAALDYLVRGYGGHFPGSFGETPIESIPIGLAALKALPFSGWLQIILFAAYLDVAAPQKDDKLPGNVQPDTPLFPVPGTAENQQREINNGRLAMISIAGIWAGELVNGGENPLTTFQPYAPGIQLP